MATVVERLVTAWEPPRSVYSTLASVDHKVIGKRYLATAFVFLIVGGLEAAVIRAQLTRSNEHLLSPEASFVNGAIVPVDGGAGAWRASAR